MKRLLAAAGALLLAATTATACAPGARHATSSPIVTIFGPYRGTEGQRFTADLDRWAAGEGIEIRYTGTGNLAADLQSRIANADPPDIAVISQPGLVEALHDDGDVRALSPEVAAEAAGTMPTDALQLGQVDGTQVGFPFRISAKSLVWYRPSQFEALGLEVPTTLNGLEALVADIQGRGLTPWCLGIEAQDATGWPATDWVEDLVVRQWGVDVYRGWIDGAVPFSDARIAQSFATFRELVLARGRVAGGPSGVLRTSVQDASAPLFTSDPGCVLYHAPSFALGWMPAGISVGPEGGIDVFDVPSVTGDAPPLVVGTDVVVSFDDRPDVEKVLAFLASPDAVLTWARDGGFLSPSDAIPPGTYDATTREILAESVEDGTTLVVDGSDAMPPIIGTDLFWSEISHWVVGSITYDELAATLDAAYPRGSADPLTGIPG